MAEATVVFQIIVLLGSMNGFVKAVGLVNSSCSRTCGNVSIPYPFGIEPGCYMSNSYQIYCNHSFSRPKPMFLNLTEMEVLDISLDGTLRVNYPRFWSCSNGTKTKFDSLPGRNLVFSQSRNRFIAIGCNNFASLNDAENVVICGCMSVCNNKPRAMNGSNSCSGINCCQATIPSDLQHFSLSLQAIDPKHDTDNPSCKFAFIVEQKWFETNLTNPFEIRNMSHAPVVLEWLIDARLSSLVTGNNLSYVHDDNSTYRCDNHSSSLGYLNSTLTCSCKPGFEGNPYLPDPQRCTGKLPLTHLRRLLILLFKTKLHMHHLFSYTIFMPWPTTVWPCVGGRGEKYTIKYFEAVIYISIQFVITFFLLLELLLI